MLFMGQETGFWDRGQALPSGHDTPRYWRQDGGAAWSNPEVAADPIGVAYTGGGDDSMAAAN